MRNTLTVALILGLAASVALPAGAAGQEKPGRPDAGKLTVGFDYLSASGEAGFIASGNVPEWGYWGCWRSQLRFDLDADYSVFTLSYALPSSKLPLGFKLQFATGDADGTTTDADWYHPQDPARWLLTESNCDAESDMLIADVGWWFSFGGKHPERGVELFAGYFQHKADFKINDLWVLDDPYNVTGGETLSGPVSTWNLKVRGARLGARTTFPLGKGFSVAAELALLLGRAEGDGNWMLREYLFEQKADGHGVDTLLALQYSPSDNLFLQAGGRYYTFVAKDGTATGVQPDYDYTDEGIVDEISVDQFGWFVGVLYRF